MSDVQHARSTGEPGPSGAGAPGSVTSADGASGVPTSEASTSDARTASVPTPGRGASDDAAATASSDPDEQVMDLLAEHVPLALLVDLLTPQGPPSADILASEGMPDGAWWEPESAPAPGPGEGTGPAGPTTAAPA